jgi:hypothetical protein
MPDLLELPPPDCIYYYDYSKRSSYTPNPQPADAWALLYDDGVGRVYCTMSYVESSLAADVEG